MDIKFKAMQTAKIYHGNQKRKYTNQSYTDHLAEVAGIVSTISTDDHVIATAWLHDIVEDTDFEWYMVLQDFGNTVAEGVLYLTDNEQGDRKNRKRKSRIRLHNAPDWVQNIKLADLISNTSSIAIHDPDFAKIYLEEKRLLIDVLKHANKDLINFATSIRVEACELIGINPYPED